MEKNDFLHYLLFLSTCNYNKFSLDSNANYRRHKLDAKLLGYLAK